MRAGRGLPLHEGEPLVPGRRHLRARGARRAGGAREVPQHALPAWPAALAAPPPPPLRAALGEDARLRRRQSTLVVALHSGQGRGPGRGGVSAELDTPRGPRPAGRSTVVPGARGPHRRVRKGARALQAGPQGALVRVVSYSKQRPAAQGVLGLRVGVLHGPRPRRRRPRGRRGPAALRRPGPGVLAVPGRRPRQGRARTRAPR
mmetsp:Transcript_19556/g.50944  ORF Transcript_19556/g.50944 Transcript_19556/m.50944 type:complete len:204 (+) Transcript_19556:213-824(+)